MLGDDLDGFITVAGFEHISDSRNIQQQGTEARSDQRVIVGNQNSHYCARLVFRTWASQGLGCDPG